jgi:dTDP-glucose 4,6-dehydratase
VNIGGTDELTVLEIADVIRGITGGESQIVHIDLPVDDPRQRRPDTSLAREVLGWTPQVSLEAGLTETVRWFDQQRTVPR